MFNKTQQNYGQPKTEVFGTFMGLKDLRHRVWGVHFCLEHDAISLAKMLKEPDDVPNVPMLRWILWIQLFDFETKHVKAESFKTEDALSRCPPSEKDETYDDIDAEEFLDAYDLAYGSLSRPSKDATPSSLTKFLLDSLYTQYSNPFINRWNEGLGDIPFYANSNAIQVPTELSNLSVNSFYVDSASALPYSLFLGSAMRNTQPWNMRRLPEFYACKTCIELTDYFLLGDEEVFLEFTIALGLSQSIPLETTALASVGHKHGTRDADDYGFWQQLSVFLKSGIYPAHLKTDKDRLRFLKRSR